MSFYAIKIKGEYTWSTDPTNIDWLFLMEEIGLGGLSGFMTYEFKNITTFFFSKLSTFKLTSHAIYRLRSHAIYKLTLSYAIYKLTLYKLTLSHAIYIYLYVAIMYNCNKVYKEDVIMLRVQIPSFL